MITQTRTCDKCNAVIPNAEYDHSATVKITIGYYDTSGTKLVFCKACWDGLFAIFAPRPKPKDAAPQPTHNERVINLITELVELLTPQP
jgi:hypothetical protein